MILAKITVAILLVTGIAAPALGQDNIGIFWDNNYTEIFTTTESTTFPEILTGYLVLKDPSNSSGLQGWECCAEADGPGQFLSWTLEGQANNFAGSPCFKVGISGPPLPSQGDVLLATFQIMITEIRAVTLSLRPDYNTSVPGQMSFFPADDPDTAFPMTTTSGQPEVAWVHEGNTWIIDPSDVLDFGQIWIDTPKEMSVTIQNTGDFTIPVVPSVADSCSAFYAISGSLIIYPGAFGTVVVGFSPSEGIEYACTLDLGDVLPDVPLFGSGNDSLPLVAPTFHDFGLVPVGIEEQFTFDVTNTGDFEFRVIFTLPDTTRSFSRYPGWFDLNPGQTRSVTVSFLPIVPGNHSVFLDLGASVPPILLVGEGDPRPMGFTIEPESLDFGWTFLGNFRALDVVIRNTGGTILEVDDFIADPNLGFSIFNDWGVTQLTPGGGVLWQIRFRPEVAGVFATELNVGPIFPPVPLTGAAESKDGYCITQPETLVFGPISAVESQTLTYSVSNSTHQKLSIYPYTSSPEFLIDNSTTIVNPGQTRTFDVTFQPQLLGHYRGTIRLNSSHCSEISLVGSAEPPLGTDQNLVGIFFDPDYSIIDTKTYQSNQIVEGYLVMLNPSETSGVGSWELEVDLEGDAQWLGWNIEGQHINVGSNNEFIVGIGGSPLPYAPEVLLATGHLMVTQPYPNLVNLELKPIWNASIPDQMAWGPWHDATMLIPLNPLTGQSIVAGINWNSASGIETPTPVAATRMLPNVPNPFNPMTEIRFELDRPQQVRVTVYDVTGRLVKVLADGHMEAGPQTRIWQGRDSGGRQVPSGVYYVRMVAGDMIDHRKIMLLK